MAANDENELISNNTANFVNLPTFDATNPQHWLRMSIYAFKAYNVTDEQQKYYLMIGALPSHIQMDAADNVKPDLPNSFKTLCDYITKITSIPTEKRIKTLLSDTQMGDRKPSQFLRYLRELIGSEADGDSTFVRSIFLDRLPKKITMIIAPPPEQSLDSIAEIADRISLYSHVYAESSTIASISSRNSEVAPFVPTPKENFGISIGNLNDSINALKIESRSFGSQLNAMQQQINSLITNFNSSMNLLQRQMSNLQPQNRDRAYKSRSTSRSRDETTLNRNLCFYHTKFGDRATKCVNPCSWNNSNQNHQQGN